MKKLLAIGALVLFTGCGTTTLYKTGATQQDFQKDQFECEMIARSYAASFSPGTSYGVGIGGAIGSGLGAGLAEGLIQRNAILRCMEVRGWHPQRPEVK